MRFSRRKSNLSRLTGRRLDQGVNILQKILKTYRHFTAQIGILLLKMPIFLSLFYPSIFGQGTYMVSNRSVSCLVSTRIQGLAFAFPEFCFRFGQKPVSCMDFFFRYNPTYMNLVCLECVCMILSRRVYQYHWTCFTDKNICFQGNGLNCLGILLCLNKE